MGIDALGFICVPQSKRYLSPQRLRLITENLPDRAHRIGVFVDRDLGQILEIYQTCNLTGVQLHGQETLEMCMALKEQYPQIFLIKALAVKDHATLDRAITYSGVADVLLLDAYDPQQAGGTGKAIDWQMLANFRPHCQWWLAGGLNPNNLQTALSLTKPDGIDVSSGVERSWGDKDLEQVQNLMAIAHEK